MSENTKRSEEILLRESSLLPPRELRSLSRKQVLDKLTSLMEGAYQRGSNPKGPSKARQRWFTVFGYLAQVSAKIAGDLEYEQLRIEVDELKKRVSEKNVSGNGRPIITVGPRVSPEKGAGRDTP